MGPHALCPSSFMMTPLHQQQTVLHSKIFMCHEVLRAQCKLYTLFALGHQWCSLIVCLVSNWEVVGPCLGPVKCWCVIGQDTNPKFFPLLLYWWVNGHESVCLCSWRWCKLTAVNRCEQTWPADCWERPGQHHFSSSPYSEASLCRAVKETCWTHWTVSMM